jgi:hypothetical protein
MFYRATQFHQNGLNSFSKRYQWSRSDHSNFVQQAVSMAPKGPPNFGSAKRASMVPEVPPKIARQFHWRVSMCRTIPCPVGTPEPSHTSPRRTHASLRREDETPQVMPKPSGERMQPPACPEVKPKGRKPREKGKTQSSSVGAKEMPTTPIQCGARAQRENRIQHKQSLENATV